MCCGLRLGFVGVLLSTLFGRAGCCPLESPVQVTLEATPIAIVADGGEATITATLSAAYTEDLELVLEAAQTPAGDAGYELSATEMTIAAGQTAGSVTLTALPLPEGIDSLSVVVRATQIRTADCSWDIDAAADAVTITAPETEPGALRVAILPEAVLGMGAQWDLDGGDLQDSGTTVTGLAPGTYTVTFTDVEGWTTPASQEVTVTSGNTSEVTGTYTQPPGALVVILLPTNAAEEGAQWNLDGGAWQDSATTLTGLAPGTYTVNYRELDGWIAPPSEQVTITSGNTTQVLRDYMPILQQMQ